MQSNSQPVSQQMLSNEQQQILNGLNAPQKELNPKYFYDQLGSELFEKITQVNEYYPTRTESKILSQYAHEIVDYIKPNAVLIEPGAGNCQKVQLILEALKPQAYLPQDVSREFLQQSVAKLSSNYPWLDVRAIVSDFSDPIIIPEEFEKYAKYAFYPGSTIGNFEPEAALDFLSNLRQLVGDQGGLLIGVDLHKSTEVLEAAYNDKQQVTARFNLNILNHINRLMASHIDVKKFQHRAFYNEDLRRIEMHLVSQQVQSYNLHGHIVNFEKGESIHTENSYKYSLEDIGHLARQSGFKLIKHWLDEQQLFSVNFFQAA